MLPYQSNLLKNGGTSTSSTADSPSSLFVFGDSWRPRLRRPRKSSRLRCGRAGGAGTRGCGAIGGEADFALGGNDSTWLANLTGGVGGTDCGGLAGCDR